MDGVTEGTKYLVTQGALGILVIVGFFLAWTFWKAWQDERASHDKTREKHTGLLQQQIVALEASKNALEAFNRRVTS